jgi:isoleucyl-tRNA synthetase
MKSIHVLQSICEDRQECKGLTAMAFLLWTTICWTLLANCLALDVLLDLYHNLGHGFEQAGILNTSLDQSQVCTQTQTF